MCFEAPDGDIISIIRTEFRETCKRYWVQRAAEGAISRTSAKKYFETIDLEYNRLWCRRRNLPHHSKTLLTRLGTGHILTNERMCRMNFFDSEYWECSYPTLTLNHLLLDCPLLEEPRSSILIYSNKWEVETRSKFGLSGLLKRPDEHIPTAFGKLHGNHSKIIYLVKATSPRESKLFNS